MPYDEVWWYAMGDTSYGPYAAVELKALAAAGELVPSDMVWKEHLAEWLTASAARGLFPTASGATPPPVPTRPAATLRSAREEAATRCEGGGLGGGIVYGLTILGALNNPVDEGHSTVASVAASPARESSRSPSGGVSVRTATFEIQTQSAEVQSSVGSSYTTGLTTDAKGLDGLNPRDSSRRRRRVSGSSQRQDRPDVTYRRA